MRLGRGVRMLACLLALGLCLLLVLAVWVSGRRYKAGGAGAADGYCDPEDLAVGVVGVGRTARRLVEAAIPGLDITLAGLSARVPVVLLLSPARRDRSPPLPFARALPGDSQRRGSSRFLQIMLLLPGAAPERSPSRLSTF
jgi:hypothetical protein